MDQDEVQRQLRQMVAFILKEAQEKSTEIRVKAEEEFDIEKQRIVQAERVKTLKEFERKEKQLHSAKRIEYSHKLNFSRLEALRRREEHLDQLLELGKQQLAGVSKQADYPQLLQQLIVQGLLTVGDSPMTVRCRPQDKGAVQGVLQAAVKAANKGRAANEQFEASLDTATLPEDNNGGVVVLARRGAIKCDNTLDQRLAIAHEQLQPRIRQLLYDE